jgi:hypothetical protein
LQRLYHLSQGNEKSLMRGNRGLSLLDDITARGREVRTHLRELLYRHKYSGDIKARVLAGYVAIALEHHQAIWQLTDQNLRGAAMAVVRTVVDAFLRALWINAYGTEQQCEQAWLDKFRFPKMHEMLKQIKEAYFGHVDAEKDPEFAVTVKKFFKSLNKVWSVASSYTHPGGRQIARRFTGDEVKPSYSDGATAEALNLATIALLLLMRTFFMSMKCQKEAEETGTMLLQWNFGERLRAAARSVSKNGSAIR